MSDSPDGNVTVMPDLDFISKLEEYYHDSSDENPINIFGLDSKYYDIEEVRPKEMRQKEHRYQILHINIQGLRSSLENLKLLLQRFEQQNVYIDFIVLCETFLSGPDIEKHYKKICKIKGYEIFYQNRKAMSKGGVAIYVKDTFKCTERPDLSIFIEGEFETIFLEVKNDFCNAIIGEVYRIPNTTEQLSVSRYEHLLDVLTQQHNKQDLIIGTDQNFDYLKINENKYIAELLDLHISHGLIPTITRPTRITPHSATLIDNIYLKINGSDCVHSGIITNKISDHLPIFTFFGMQIIQKKPPLQIKSRNFDNQHMGKICETLSKVDWTELEDKDLNEAYDLFTTKILNIINDISPVKTITIPAKRIIRDPWVTKGVIKSATTLDKLYRNSLRKPKDHPKFIEYKKYRNLYNRLK